MRFILIALLSVPVLFGMPENISIVEVKKDKYVMNFFKLDPKLCIDIFLEENKETFNKHTLFIFPPTITFPSNLAFEVIEFHKEVIWCLDDSIPDLYRKLQDAFAEDVSITYKQDYGNEIKMLLANRIAKNTQGDTLQS